MSRFVIHGSNPVGGRHVVPGNKNAALPMIAATLLADGPVTLRNLPWIRDVHVMLELLQQLGAKVECDVAAHTARIDPSDASPRPLDAELCRRVRTSLLFAGPLLARFGTAAVPSPGGDGIGRRRLDTHFDGLRALGAEITETEPFVFRAPQRLRGRRILFDEASVTATENVLMAAVLADGITTLYNAACEPHVQDLCRMLNRMGADISGVGTNRLVVTGVRRLGGTETRIGPDAIEAASYLAAAAATHGTLEVAGADPEEMEVVARPFARLGIRWNADPDGTLRLPAEQAMRVASDFGNAVPSIADGVWPMIPSDVMSALVVLATRVDGTVLFFEKLFESRLYFVDHLLGMGARIVQCDPHRILVQGPTPLRGTTVSSPDIRAGMALLIAALSARGTTVIHNAESIDRGYESVEVALRALGADIERVV